MPTSTRRLSECCRMLTAACRQAALQHHRRPSLELVGGGVHDAPLHRAVPQGDFLALCAHSVDKRQPLQGLRNALGLVVGGGALTPPRTVAHRPLAPLSGELDFCEAKRLRGSRSLPPSFACGKSHLPRQREARPFGQPAPPQAQNSTTYTIPQILPLSRLGRLLYGKNCAIL